MALLRDWKQILRRAWSVRLIVLAGLLSGLEIVLPFFVDIPAPRWVMPSAMFLATMSALIARLVAQKNLHEDTDG